MTTAFVLSGGGRQALSELAATWHGLRRGDVFPFDPLRHLLALAGTRDSLCTDRGLRRLIEAHLIRRAHDATGEWIDSGGPALPFPERFLSLHHHRRDAAHAPASRDHDGCCHPTAA